MAQFIAKKIIEGEQIYSQVFKIKMYQRYRDAVDAILIQEGKQELIKI